MYYIQNGDNLTSNIWKQIKDNSIDLLLTDPPYNISEFTAKRAYNIGNMRSNSLQNIKDWDSLSLTEYLSNMDKLFYLMTPKIKKGANAIIFCSSFRLDSIIKIAENYNFYYKTTGVWHKTNPMPRNMNLHFVNSNEFWLYFVYDKKTGTFNNKNKLITDFIECATPSNSERQFGKHPTQKPVKLIDWFIKLLSNENDTVFDPFMGTGSTGVSAYRLNRNFIGIELNTEYFKIAGKRLEQLI